MEDAGYELIGNTFVIINKANFTENEILALNELSKDKILYF